MKRCKFVQMLSVLPFFKLFVGGKEDPSKVKTVYFGPWKEPIPGYSDYPIYPLEDIDDPVQYSGSPVAFDRENVSVSMTEWERVDSDYHDS